MLRRLRWLVVAVTAVCGLLVPLSAGVAHAGTVSASAPVAAPGGANGTDITVTLPYGGVDRSYTLFVPNGLPATPVPLVVVLHYYSGTAATMESLTGFDPLGGDSKALVAYPRGVATRGTPAAAAGSRSRRTPTTSASSPP